MGCSMSAKEQVMQPSANIQQDGTVEKKPEVKKPAEAPATAKAAEEAPESNQTSPNKAEPKIEVKEDPPAEVSCAGSAADAGGADAGSADAGGADAASADAGGGDAASADAGGADVGSAEAGGGADGIDVNDGVTTEVATPMDLDVFRWQNKMRTDPTSFIPDLEAMLPKFDGNLYNNYLQTQEGAAVVQELIEYLKTVEPVHPLEWVDDIAKASKDHVLDCAPTGATGHDGVDGSTFGERMDRYTKREGSSGENISYGQNDAKGVVIQLAVDDGVESRGHRLNIMNGAYVKTGCFSGEHSQYTYSTVLNYNGDPKRIGKGGAIFDFDAFMAEEVVWEDEPEGHCGYSESCAGGVGDCKATKTVTRTYNMPDGSQVTKEQVIEREI